MSILEFDSQLSLANPGTTSNAWNPYTDASLSYGSLLLLRETGNLQFLGEDCKIVVWESFAHPTDTLLPGQLMAPGTLLRSRASDNSFSSGRFIFVVQKDGNIVIVGTLQLGYPLLLCQDSRSYP